MNFQDKAYQIVQKERRPQLIIADPSLRDFAGHHYITSLRLVRSAERFGFSGILAAHKDFQQTFSECTIFGVYSESIYCEKFPTASPPHNFNYPENRPIAGMSAETSKFLEFISATREDIIFFHTMTINATISVLEGLLTFNPAVIPSYHFLFRYDPLFENWAGDPAELQRLLKRLNACGLDGLTFLYAETRELAETYEQLIDFPVRVISHFPAFDVSTSASARKFSSRLQVAYFGEARLEKGFDALPSTIASVYDTWPGGFEFVCQTYFTEANKTGISEVVARLRVDAEARGYQLFDVLDVNSYNALLVNSDVIVLPHRLPQYSKRGSGVFIDALCSDATVVLRAGTSMANFDHKNDIVKFANDAEMAEALRTALTHARDKVRTTPVDVTLFTPESNIEVVIRNHFKTGTILDRNLMQNSASSKHMITAKDAKAKPRFFSIITAVRNDTWSLVKTMRSVFEQSFTDFEYIIIDGASDDNALSLIEFWCHQGLVSSFVSEPDSGVYNAMNKGLSQASGQFVCFLNASDIFADVNVLQRVHGVLSKRPLDGLLGWGELNDQIWGAWTESEAFKMASLGFCHQSLYVRRTVLLDEQFDERPFKTDSDTLQLGRLYAKGASIAILPEVLAVRGGDPGISADLQRSGISIRNTLAEEYPSLTESTTELLLAFRRKCHNPEAILALLDTPDRRFVCHLARVVLDTLFRPESIDRVATHCEHLVNRCLEILGTEDGGREDVDRLIVGQSRRAQFLEIRKTARRELDRAIIKFAADEARRIEKLREDVTFLPAREPADMIISLTSFPARLKTVSFAIQSLLEQTCPPKEIHLWLGRDEIPGKNWLPKRLSALEERGLQIHFSKRTYHQYDKFLHNAALNKNSPFVIVDDDVIYPPRALEHLLAAHQRHPESVIGNRCHRMELDRTGALAPYVQWEREVRMSQPSLLLLPTGAGGVLYPPGFLNHRQVTDIENILACAPYADDIWLKFCALANSVPTFATELSHLGTWYHRYTPTMQAGTLMATNVERGLNDVQVARCISWLTLVKPDWRSELMAELVDA